MKLYGVTLDFNDMKSCGLLPELCLDWDHRSEELSENEKLISYWEHNLQNLLKETKNVVVGNIENRSIIYSADKKAIDLIQKHFKEIELSTVLYEELIQCDYCIKHDYLKVNK